MDRATFEKEYAYPDSLHDYKYFSFHEMYLPSGKMDSMWNSYLSYHLFAFNENENILFQDKDTSKEKFRFLWLRTFNRPVMIKMEHSKNKTLLTIKVTDGFGGYTSGLVKTTIIKEFNDTVFTKFNKILENTNFWQMKFSHKEDMNISDGSDWLYEANFKGKYQITECASPTSLLKLRPDSSRLKTYAEIGKYLIDLIDVDYQKQAFY
jgi:hypothetical protein